MAQQQKRATLRSTVDPEFTIQIDERVIDCCNILQNVQEHAKDESGDEAEIAVEMTKKQMEQFVALHNHFPSADAPKDLAWTNDFFKAMPDAEFKALCFAADYLDSQRFLEASGDFALNVCEGMEEQQIREYLNIVNDYSPEERQAIAEHPLEFFTGASIQHEEGGAKNDEAPNTDDK